MQLNIPFSEIPEHGIECEIRDAAWFPEDFAELAGPVTSLVRLTKKDDNKIELKGMLAVNIALVCDRCLKRYVYSVESQMQLVIEVGEKSEHWHMQDIESSGAELETISLERPVVELGELLRQQLYLAVPDKRLCTEKCAGLCPQCGANMNEKKCGCAAPPPDSPFAVLGSLKKK